jgi:hypothetical protein
LQVEEEYVRVKKSDLQSILSQIEEMKKKLEELKK